MVAMASGRRVLTLESAGLSWRPKESPVKITNRQAVLAVAASMLVVAMSSAVVAVALSASFFVSLYRERQIRSQPISPPVTVDFGLGREKQTAP